MGVDKVVVGTSLFEVKLKSNGGGLLDKRDKEDENCGAFTEFVFAPNLFELERFGGDTPQIGPAPDSALEMGDLTDLDASGEVNESGGFVMRVSRLVE